MNEDHKNRISVTIYGRQYKIVGNASSNYIRMVADYIDEKMMSISDGNPRLDSSKIAVLAAVNIADEYFKLKQEYDELIQLLESEEE